VALVNVSYYCPVLTPCEAGGKPGIRISGAHTFTGQFDVGHRL